MPTLIWDRPDGGRQVFPLSPGDATIGRDAGNAVCIESHYVSKHHAIGRLTPQGFLLTDLGSSNGTFVNGQQVTTALLRNGDTVDFGQERLMFADGPPPVRPPAAARRNSRPVVLALAGGVCLLAVVLVAFLLMRGSGAPFARLYQPVIARAVQFRNRMVFDGPETIRNFATPDVQAFMDRLNRDLWTLTKSRVGWSFLLNTSVAVVGGAAKPGPLVAFYNPWCDLFLVTEWTQARGEWRISDAELLLGDWVRRGGEFPMTPKPLWLREKGAGSGSLAQAYVTSITAFEKQFPADRPVGNWRKALNAEDRDAVRGISHKAAALVCLEALIELDEYRNLIEPDNAVGTAVKASVENVIRRAGAGQLRQATESAPETTALTPKAITVLLGQAPVKLAVVKVLAGPTAAMVFLAPLENADFAVALRYRVGDDTAELREATLIHYQAIYQAAARRQAGVAGE
jgi:hypothetical protein